MKTCSKCKESRDNVEFRNSRAFRDGKHPACKVCDRAYRQSRLDIDRQKKRDWYQSHKRRIADSRRLNADDRRKAARAYYAAHAVELRASALRRFRANRDLWNARSRDWRARNKSKVIALARRRDARIRALTIGNVSASGLDARAAVFGNRCAYCGGAHEQWDHAKPLAKGGPHCLANLRPSCKRCNQSKAAKWPWPVRSVR